MPTDLGLSLQDAKATSWLNASKGSGLTNEKFPCFSFNDKAMDAQDNREHSVSGTNTSTSRPENYLCHAAFIDLAVRQEERKCNSLYATSYFLYRVYWG